MHDTSKLKLIRIAKIGVVIIGLLVLIFLIIGSNNKKQPGYDARYYDKYSGETLSDIREKSPEKASGIDSGPLYLGFRTLIDRGYSQQQLTSVQTAIQEYISSSRPKTKHVSFDVKSFERPGLAGKEADASYSTFNVVFDFDELYTARLTANSGQTLNFKLYDTDKKLVIDSTYDPGAYDQPAGAE